MTYREKVLFLLEINDGLTCTEIVKELKIFYPEDREKDKSTLMATVSGLVYKLCQDSTIKSHPFSRGPRGGIRYIIWDYPKEENNYK